MAYGQDSPLVIKMGPTDKRCEMTLVFILQNLWLRIATSHKDGSY